MSATYYTDAHHSVIDPLKLQRSREMVQPLRNFSSQIARLSDRTWLFNDLSAEKCLLEWLTKWSQAGALLGDANYQGEFERKWALAGIALSYLKVDHLLSWTPAQRAVVVEWIEKLALRVREDYNQKLDRQSRHNNHIYWVSLAVMSASILTGDRNLYDWALLRARQGALDVTVDGFLPQELERARRARHYQSFALQALAMLSVLARPNGTEILSVNNEALSRLEKRTLEGYHDHSVFEHATSVIQEEPDEKDLSWIVIYSYLRPRELKLHGLDVVHPVYSAWLGGDLSAAFVNQTN